LLNNVRYQKGWDYKITHVKPGSVPVSPALQRPTNNIEDVHHFASEVGYPIMVKAVDGGGGRGIRLIHSEDQLPALVKRAVEESPSKQVFAEKAAIDGFRHIEVQIIGDGSGNVTHLWDRECSIQRRYQKIIELAPSVVSDRKLIAKVIVDALRMARHVSAMVRPELTSLIYLGKLLLPWYIRVSCEPSNEGILLSGSQPTPAG
jgi:pyruvate carboxylase